MLPSSSLTAKREPGPRRSRGGHRPGPTMAPAGFRAGGRGDAADDRTVLDDEARIPRGTWASRGRVKPTSWRRSARAGITSIARWPRKNGLFLAMAQLIPASCGKVRPSVSWPTMMWPFSSRRTRCASTPKGRMPSRVCRSQEQVPQGGAVGGGAVDLVAELADEADAQHAYGDAGEAAGAAGEIGKGLGREVDVGVELAQHVARLRARDVDAGIGGGDVGDVDRRAATPRSSAAWRGRARRRRRWWR